MKGQKGIKTVLFFIGIIGIGVTVLPFFLNPPGSLFLQLKDDIFHSDLSERTLSLSSGTLYLPKEFPIGKAEEGYCVTAGNIPSGENIRFDIAVNGFNPVSLAVSIPPMETVKKQVSLKPRFGRVKITAMNAYKNSLIPFFTGTISGKPGIRKEGGSMIFDLEPGTYEANLEAAGYCAALKQVKSVEGKISEVRADLSPVLKENELARIMLDWDENPRDLDAHLILPRKQGLRTTHVYFGNKTSTKASNGKLAASLDVDHQHSEGVETITIYKTVKGTFQYGVHLYAGSGTIGGSNATVTLVTDGCRTRTFDVFPSCGKKYWYVMNLNWDGTELEVEKKNICKKLGWKSREKP